MKDGPVTGYMGCARHCHKPKFLALQIHIRPVQDLFPFMFHYFNFRAAGYRAVYACGSSMIQTVDQLRPVS